MKKILTIIISMAMCLTLLGGFMNAPGDGFGLFNEECEHDFGKWKSSSSDGVDGKLYHHRVCKICGYVESEPHENRYGGCSICGYGLFDFSSVNLSDTAGMTVAELWQYMADIFGEQNLESGGNISSGNHFRVDFGTYLGLNISVRKFLHGETDGAEYLDIDMELWDPWEEELRGLFYVMDGIQMGDTCGHMLSEAEARGYKINIRQSDVFGHNVVTIDDGKSIFEFTSYPHEDLDYNPEIYVEDGALFTCRECYGGDHPQHDISDINIDGILGMEQDEGIAMLKEAFGADCVDTSTPGYVSVNRYKSGAYDYFGLRFNIKQNIFYSVDINDPGYEDHANMKPTVISEMPKNMTVSEITKLADELEAEVYARDDTSIFSGVPEGAQTISYAFTLDKYRVVYHVHNYRPTFEAHARGVEKLIPEDEWPDTIVAMSNVKLLDSALPFVPGDLNSSGGEPDVLDGVVMQRILASLEPEITAADLNHDGIVNVADGVVMQRILAGLE